MTDDYGSRYSSAYPFPLLANSSRLYSGSLNGVIGPDDTTDEDWFKVFLQKGATYEFKLTGGYEIYDLNDGILRWKNKSNSYIASEYWDSDFSSDDGTIITTPISSSGNYYLQVDLNGNDLDVGAYTLSVEQLTEGFTSHLTRSLSTSMTDDYGSRYTSSETFPLTTSNLFLDSGSINGIIGPEDTSDEDWFKVFLQKGATYEFKLTGGSEVYDLNDGVLRWKNQSNSYIASEYWDSDFSSDDGTIITTPISSSGNYYLQVDLNGGSLDVGAYTLEVEQLTPGFQSAEPTPTPAPIPTSTATPNPVPSPGPTDNQSPHIVNNYYTTNNTNNNTNTTITNTGNGNIQTGNIGTVENKIYIVNSFELSTISINLSTAITGERKRRETVKGTSGDDLIADGAGKDKLIGNDGADQFYFSGEEPYKKKFADRVLDFDASEGDAIVIAEDVVSNPAITDKVINNLEDTGASEIPVAETRRQLKQLSDDGHQFVYNERKGELLLDNNGTNKGFAGKGDDPLIANVGKKTELTDALIDDVIDDLEADPSLAVAESRKELKRLAKDDYDLIYFEPKGDLYVDGNGANKGFGKKADGGLIADLPNNSTLSDDNLLIAD